MTHKQYQPTHRTCGINCGVSAKHHGITDNGTEHSIHALREFAINYAIRNGIDITSDLNNRSEYFIGVGIGNFQARVNK